MKKLYENIEDIYIKGGAGQLTEVISSMDISLQNISQGTETIYGLLMKYSSTNKGAQYEKVVNTTNSLREKLYDASLQLNEMQNEVVAYQNKIYRYEDMSESASAPNQYLVERTGSVNVDTSAVQFTLADMLELSGALKEYSEAVIYHLKNIVDGKNNIGSVWQDTQYNDFSEFIETICTETVEGLKVFDDYVEYLDEKIKELS